MNFRVDFPVSQWPNFLTGLLEITTSTKICIDQFYAYNISTSSSAVAERPCDESAILRDESLSDYILGWMADFPNVVAERHILGVRTQGGGLWSPNSNSAEIFVQCSYSQVLSSYVYSFGSYRVDKHIHKHTNTHTHKQTNRRRWKHPSLFATLRRWVTIIDARSISVIGELFVFINFL